MTHFQTTEEANRFFNHVAEESIQTAKNQQPLNNDMKTLRSQFDALQKQYATLSLENTKIKGDFHELKQNLSDICDLYSAHKKRFKKHMANVNKVVKEMMELNNQIEQEEKIQKTEFTCAIIGEKAVGKTTFIRYIESGSFIPLYIPTDGCIFHQLNFGTDFKNQKIKFTCVDCPSDPIYQDEVEDVIKQSDCVIIMINDDTSDDNISDLQEIVRKLHDDVPILFVFNYFGRIPENKLGSKSFPKHTISINVCEGFNIDAPFCCLIEHFWDTRNISVNYRQTPITVEEWKHIQSFQMVNPPPRSSTPSTEYENTSDTDSVSSYDSYGTDVEHKTTNLLDLDIALIGRDKCRDLVYDTIKSNQADMSAYTIKYKGEYKAYTMSNESDFPKMVDYNKDAFIIVADLTDPCIKEKLELLNKDIRDILPSMPRKPLYYFLGFAPEDTPNVDVCEHMINKWCDIENIDCPHLRIKPIQINTYEELQKLMPDISIVSASIAFHIMWCPDKDIARECPDQIEKCVLDVLKQKAI